MKYYVVNGIIMKDETTPQSVFCYDSKDDAFSVYHTTLASNYANKDIRSFFVCILDSYGVQINRESFDTEHPLVS